MNRRGSGSTSGTSHARHGEAREAAAEVGGLRSSVDPVPCGEVDLHWQGQNIGEPRGATASQVPRRSEGRGDGPRGLPASAPKGDKVRKLQIVLYRKAKAEPKYRFWSLYGELVREDVLRKAWRQVKANGGAPGIDGQTIGSIGVSPEAEAEWLRGLAEELRAKVYRPMPVRRVWIPKACGGQRPLGIPTVKDRVVRSAAAMLLMPIWEADFHENSHGYRPKRSTKGAMDQIQYALWDGLREVVDADLSKYFDTIPHRELMRLVARRVSDGAILKLIKAWLRAPVVEEGEDGKKRVRANRAGTPQGGVISPLLANLYLDALDWAVNALGRNQCRMVRYADDLVILCRKGKGAGLKARLRRWLEARGLKLNEEKTRLVDAETESFCFLGFCVLMRKGRRGGRVHPQVSPSSKSCKACREAVREILHRGTHWRPTAEVVRSLNRLSRGWAGAFHYDECRRAFGQLEDYTRQKLRTWLWRKHGRRKGRYKFYTCQKLHGQYGLWKWPGNIGHRRKQA